MIQLIAVMHHGSAFLQRLLRLASGSLLLLLTVLCALGAEPKRVLLIHSFGREFEPFRTFSENFRSELARLSAERLDLFDVAVQGARFDDGSQEGPLVDYVLALFTGRRLDLVVPIGGPAVRFARRHRERLFPGTPMLLAAVDERHLQDTTLAPNEAVVAVRHDPPLLFEDVLRLVPATTNIVVVFGNSPLEKFWVAEIRRELDSLTNRTGFTWLNQLSFEQIKARVGALPARSAVFYGQMTVDASGVPYAEERALAELRAVANAPIFGVHDYQLGRGIVGGRLSPVLELSRRTAVAAGQILRGESPGDIRPPPLRPGPPLYDWRELRRWGINEARLPPGSEVRFREPALWQRYFGQIVLMILALLAQGVIISFLLVNRARRCRAEQTAREFGGRLLHAQEAERARLARELHDDITQRLARLAIDAGRIESGRAGAAQSETMRDVRDGLVRLSEDVHSLAYKLHPSLVEDLGLADALRAECERLSRLESISIDVRLDPVPGKIPRDAGLCLFRVTQEALRNVVRHARTRAAEVSLRLVDDGLQLAVKDGGVGFDPRQQRRRPSLGLASMRERVRLIDGDLDIDSAPGHGTTIVAWVPWKGAST